eukprot:3810451-Pyramimonas_sp.AAC.1
MKLRECANAVRSTALGDSQGLSCRGYREAQRRRDRKSAALTTGHPLLDAPPAMSQAAGKPAL